jgi:NADH-quinone oxidoreductase subunit K
MEGFPAPCDRLLRPSCRSSLRLRWRSVCTRMSSTILIETLPNLLLFSFLLFLAGLLGMVYNYKNYLVTMMSVELMYLGAISSFVFYSNGAVYGLLILILAACESSIGLGLLIVLYRFGRSIDFSSYEALGG